jgi:hypothetical protein
MRITESYPEVDLYWLINGNGSFPKGDTIYNASNVSAPIHAESIQETKTQDLFSADEMLEIKIDEKIEHSDTVYKSDKTIDRIVVFYKDGTFKNYNEVI